MYFDGLTPPMKSSEAFVLPLLNLFVVGNGQLEPWAMKDRTHLPMAKEKRCCGGLSFAVWM